MCFYLFYKLKETVRRRNFKSQCIILTAKMSQRSTFFPLPFYNFGNFQTKGSFMDIFPQLKEGIDVPLKNSDLQKISRACSTTFLPQDFATIILSVPPLKNALKLLHLKELQEQSKSLCKRKEDPSVLRVGSKCYQQLVSFSWAKSLTEWQERAPDVLDTLSAIAVPDTYLSSPKRADAIIPPLCTACSILLNTRNAELSLVQKMVSVVLGLGGCSKMV